MIHDVDASLSDLLTAEALDGSGAEVVFDAPTKEWVARRSAPAVDAFLYDIREDTGRRDVFPQPIRNDQGRTVGLAPPARRFKLSYLLTAWTRRPEDEHRLLSRLLTTLVAFDRIPDRYLRGGLAGGTLPVILQLALPPGQDRSLSDIWSALGGELKPSLDLVVIAPVDPARTYEVGPPVDGGPELRLDRLPGPEGQPPAAGDEPAPNGDGDRRPSPPRRRAGRVVER